LAKNMADCPEHPERIVYNDLATFVPSCFDGLNEIDRYQTNWVTGCMFWSATKIHASATLQYNNLGILEVPIHNHATFCMLGGFASLILCSASSLSLHWQSGQPLQFVCLAFCCLNRRQIF
jgi:hypothetical protein